MFKYLLMLASCFFCALYSMENQVHLILTITLIPIIKEKKVIGYQQIHIKNSDDVDEFSLYDESQNYMGSTLRNCLASRGFGVSGAATTKIDLIKQLLKELYPDRKLNLWIKDIQADRT